MGCNIDDCISPYEIRVEPTHFTENISGTTISSGQTEAYEAWNSLTVADVLVQAGATADFLARNQVNINSEFHAEYGSEVHIYCEDVYPDCSMVPHKITDEYSTNTDTSQTAKNNEIRLLFHKNTSLLSCNVFPNPCKGKFTLSVQQSESEGCYVRVTDIMGNIILPEQNMNGSATAFDISAFGKGVYYIWVYVNNSIMVKKIICL